MIKKLILLSAVFLSHIMRYISQTYAKNDILPKSSTHQYNIPQQAVTDMWQESYKNHKVLLVEMEVAQLIILNKITAKSAKKEFYNEKEQSFGNLSITLNKCIQRTGLSNINDAMMLVTIYDKKISDKVPIFYNWLISSNHSVSTIEHPTYEIIAVACKRPKNNDK